MDIRTHTCKLGITYISLTDIAKIYRAFIFKKRRELKTLNVSQTVTNFPKSFYYSVKGRNGGTYVTISGLELFLTTRRITDIDFKKELYDFIKIKANPNSEGNLEGYFISLVIDFCSEMFKDLSFETQKPIEGKIFDLCINNFLVIEFDEVQHANKGQKENDLIKSKIIENSEYILIRINSREPFGRSLSHIYKKLKSHLL